MLATSETAADRKMDEDSVLRTPSAIRIWRGRLVIKLQIRKHMAGGSRTDRTCLCENYPGGYLTAHVPQVYCPAFFSWERVCQHVRSGERLCSSSTGQMFADRLRNLAARSGHERAAKTGRRGAIRCAAQTTLESGEACAQISKVGQWHSAACRVYLGALEAAAMTRILIVASDGEGVEEQGPWGDPIS